MALLSRKADYALLILSHLYQKEDSATAREIADKFQLGRPFVANILKELCHKGFVRSTRGVKGGYVLERTASDTTLSELLEAIEEGFQLTVCNTPNRLESGSCEVEALCTVKTPMHAIHGRIMDVLRGVTLSDIFHPPAAVRLQPALNLIDRPTSTTQA